MSALGNQDADKSILDLFDEVWKWRLEVSPEFASYCGVHTFDDKLDNIDEQTLQEWQAQVESFDKKSKTLNTSAASKEVCLGLQLLQEEFKVFLSSADCHGWNFPINNLEGVHHDIHLLLSFAKFDSEDDFNKYIKRLQCYPRQIQQVIQMCNDGIKMGYVNHSCSVKEVPSQIAQLVANGLLLDKSAFLSPFKKDIKLEDEMKKRLLATTEEVLRSQVLPAFSQLEEYIKDVYLNKCRNDLGTIHLPNGAIYYQQCLNFHTSTTMSATEVYELGLQEVERITKEVHKITMAEGFGTDTKKFMKQFKENKDFYYKTEEDLLNGVNKICTERIRPQLSRLFHSIPDADMSIQPTPEGMSSAPIGYYMSGTYDGSRPGVYYINTAQGPETPIYELVALSLHEGEPGHHLQSMYAIQKEELPVFRQYIEDMKYSRAPTRFSLHTAYIEGWGLYSEFLGEELEMYRTNYELFGRYSFEILRAARLVVDTGMHVMGWSLEKAQQYLEERAFIPKVFADNEVRRYVTWPGQACAYKIGEIKIKELRTKAEKELGEHFDVRDFHAAVLDCGPVPLNVLESSIYSFIDDKIRQCN